MLFFEATCEFSGEPSELFKDVGDVVMLSCMRQNLDSAALYWLEFKEVKAWKAT